MNFKSTIIGGMLALLMAGPALAQTVDGPPVFWKVSMWGNPRALSAGIEAVAEKIREDTGGKFNIKVFYGAQLSNSRENLDGLKLNAFEGACICNFYHPGKNPAWMVFSLPFLPLGDPQVARYVRNKLYEHPDIVADMEKWNAIPYVSGLLPQYEILGRGTPPTQLDDWEGLRVRAGGGIGDALETLGAVKQTLPAGETSPAFQRGALDAAAFPYTYAHVSFKIHEQADWFTANLAPGTSECGWLWNKPAYEALPSQYKELLEKYRDLAFDAELEAYATADEKNIPLFKETMTEIVYTDEQLAQFHEVAGKPVWDAWIAANQDAFDAQGLFDAVFEYAEEAKAAMQ